MLFDDECIILDVISRPVGEMDLAERRQCSAFTGDVHDSAQHTDL